MFVHGKPLFSFLAIAREAFPDTGCESTAGERAEDKDPELLQCITSLEEGGTDGARGIDGSAGVADAGEVHEDEGETDGESGEIAGALLLIGGTEYYEHEYEGEELPADFICPICKPGKSCRNMHPCRSSFRRAIPRG